MHSFPRWKIWLVLFACLVGVLFALPNVLNEKQQAALPSWFPTRVVNLGLDLRGGSHLLLELDFDAYVKEQLENLLADARIALRGAQVGYKDLSVNNGAVTFSLRDPADASRIEGILRKLDASLEVEVKDGTAHVSYGERQLAQMRQHVLEQSIEIVRRRVDETGTKEPIIQAQGESRVLLQVPGVDDPEKLKALLGKTAKMTFHLVDVETSVMDALQNKTPPGSVLMPYDESEHEKGRQFEVVKKKVILSGDLLVDAHATFEQGMPVVAFRFNTLGARKFGEVTSQNVGKPFAIVLDDQIISAPTIREPILAGSGIISGNFTVESANDLALLLRAGALPAPLKVVEERTVGPSLGADSIEAGKRASILGVVLVMGFMLLSYSLFGLFANFALVMNLVFIMAALSLFQATLTLPGIAGIVLVLGMAVDANVLIFERIREEIKLGKSLLAAVDNGFSRAFATILDSNITTLIAAALLFWLGSGTVKGFAVTLTIGILASMFTAVTLTRLMVSLWLRKARPKTLPV